MDRNFEQSDIPEAEEIIIDGVPTLIIDGEKHYTKETMKKLTNTKQEES